VNTVIDIGTELLVDESTIRDPYLRLLTSALGERLLAASPWVALDKRMAAVWLEPRTVQNPPQPAKARVLG
jgi:hypothetical protein